MNRLRPLLAALPLLAACATPPAARDEAARTWLGSPYEELIARWGTPARSTTLDDGRMAHTWVSETTERRGMLFPSIGVFGGSGGIGGVGVGATVGPGGIGLLRCERTLIFRDGRVAGHAWLGDPDYCSGFRRAPGAREQQGEIRPVKRLAGLAPGAG